MKKVLNRVLSVVLSLVMCVSLLNLTAFASRDWGKEPQSNTCSHRYAYDQATADGDTCKRTCTECGEVIDCKHSDYYCQWHGGYQDKQHTGGDGYCDYCHAKVGNPNCPGPAETECKHIGTGRTETTVREATCMLPKLVDIYCNQCNTKIAQNEVRGTALGHAWGTTWTDDNSSSHEQAGTHSMECTRTDCDGNHTSEAQGKKTESHTYGAGVSQGNGATRYTCTACGHWYEVACNHANLTATPAVEPNCTTAGNYAYWTCNGCGTVFSDAAHTTVTTVAAMTRAALNHNFVDSWTDDNPNVYGTTGTHSRICTRCNGSLDGGSPAGVAHTFTDNWSGWSDYSGTDHGLNPTATQKVQVSTRQCTANGCTHTERRFQAVEKASKTVNVQYVEQGNTTNVLGTASFTLLEDGTGEGSVEQRTFGGYTYSRGAGVPVTYAGSTDRQTLTVYYTRNSYTLTVAYTGLPAAQALQSKVTENVPYDSDISVGDIPAVTGYTGAANADNATKMPAANTTIYVDYTANQHTLTIVYTGLPIALAIESTSATVAYGAAVAVAIHPVAGYTGAIRNAANVPATMPDEDLTVYVDYAANAPDTYPLFVSYVFEDGTTAASTYTATLEEGTDYSVTSPAIEGYTPDRAVVSGSMGRGMARFTVTYTADAIIDEPDVPLVEEPDVDIEEPDVPLVEEPEIEIEIEEPDVPLADVPETGDGSGLWFMSAVLSAMGLALLFFTRKREGQEG